MRVRSHPLFQCQVAAEIGLHPTDLQAIHALGAGALSAGDLSGRLRLTSGATTAAIDRRVDLGYAERLRDETDRRKVMIALCEDKAGGLRAKYRHIDQRIRKLLAQRSPNETKVIAEFLAALIEGAAGTEREG
jgi:DNA-binding MarR family transcriptional regulator